MAAKDKKVLYIFQKIHPCLPKSDLTHVARYPPEHTQDAEDDVRIFTPYYGLVNERRNQLHEAIRLSGINVIVNDYDHPFVIKVVSIPSTRVQVCFIDNADLSGHRGSSDPSSGGASSDNADRSASFIRGVLEATESLHWVSDVIHYLGWFSALVSVYLKTTYKNDPYFERAKVFFLADGNEEEGKIGEDLIKKFESNKITGNLLDPLQGKVTSDALRRMAIRYSDDVILGQESVSPGLIEYFRSKPSHEVLEYLGPAVDHVEAYVDPYRSFTE